MDLSLGRIKSILNHLKNPQDSLKVVHVSGTNGKGSTIAYISSILLAANYVVGEFTSPYLRYPHDSIRINKIPISTEVYNFARGEVRRVETLLDVELTPFERLTVIAFLVFSSAKANIDICLIEAGLGGLNDATNVFSKPILSVITSVSMDHEREIGPTLKDIARNEAGIIKPNVDVILAIQDSSDIYQAIYDLAEQVHSGSIFEVEDKMVELGAFGKVVNITFPHVLKGLDDIGVTWAAYHTPFKVKPGLGTSRIQQENLSVALTTVAHLFRMHFRNKLTIETVRRGIQSARWPGRLDQLTIMLNSTQSLSILLDGSHNEDGVFQLSEYIQSVYRLMKHKQTLDKLVWVIAFSSSKNYAKLLELFKFKSKDRIICTQFTTPVVEMPWIHAVSPEKVKEKVEMIYSNSLTAYSESNFQSAMIRAAKFAIDAETTKQTTQVIVCGSLYLVADIYREYVPDDRHDFVAK